MHVAVVCVCVVLHVFVCLLCAGDSTDIADMWDVNITLKTMLCLKDGVWLNSEVITFMISFWASKHNHGLEQVMPVSVCVCVCVCVQVHMRCWYV